MKKNTSVPVGHGIRATMNQRLRAAVEAAATRKKNPIIPYHIALALGIHPCNFYNWKSGDRDFGPDRLHAVAKLIGFSFPSSLE